MRKHIPEKNLYLFGFTGFLEIQNLVNCKHTNFAIIGKQKTHETERKEQNKLPVIKKTKIFAI